MVFILPTEFTARGINDALKVDDSERIGVTEDEVRLVVSAGLTM
jgi:hypothetical protein